MDFLAQTWYSTSPHGSLKSEPVDGNSLCLCNSFIINKALKRCQKRAPTMSLPLSLLSISPILELGPMSLMSFDANLSA